MLAKWPIMLKATPEAIKDWQKRFLDLHGDELDPEHPLYIRVKPVTIPSRLWDVHIMVTGETSLTAQDVFLKHFAPEFLDEDHPAVLFSDYADEEATFKSGAYLLYDGFKTYFSHEELMEEAMDKSRQKILDTISAFDTVYNESKH